MAQQCSTELAAREHINLLEALGMRSALIGVRHLAVQKHAQIAAKYDS